MEDKFYIDDIYREKMSDFESQPALDSFDAVMNKLQAARRRKRLALILIFAGILGLGSWLTAPYFKSTETKAGNTVAQNRPLKKASPSQNELHNAITKEVQAGNEVADKIVKTSTIKNTQKEKIHNSITDLVSTQKSTETPGDQSPQNTTTITFVTKMPTEALVLGGTRQEDLNKPGSDSSQYHSFISLAQKECDMFYLDDYQDVVRTNNIVDRELLYIKERLHRPVLQMYLAVAPVFIKSSFRLNNSAYIQPGGTGFDLGKAYLSDRRLQNSFEPSMFYSVSGLIRYYSGWELGASLGFLRIKNKEKVYNLPVSLISNPPTMAFNSATPSSAGALSIHSDPSGDTYVNTFGYISAGISASRILRAGRQYFMAGGGIYFNQVIYSRFINLSNNGQAYYTSANEVLNPVNLNVVFKLGYTRQLSPRAGLRLLPLFIYSPTSVFNENYLLSQKRYGFGVEGGITFRIN